jgi:hypothetical protein
MHALIRSIAEYFHRYWFLAFLFFVGWFSSELDKFVELLRVETERYAKRK